MNTVNRKNVIRELKRICDHRYLNNLMGTYIIPFSQYLDIPRIFEYAETSGHWKTDLSDKDKPMVELSENGVVCFREIYNRVDRTIQVYDACVFKREREWIERDGYYCFIGCLPELFQVFGEDSSEQLKTILKEIINEQQSANESEAI